MDAYKINRLERILGRTLSNEEKERLRRIKDILEISDNDALWDILTAMEYQRKYYDELPEKISGMAAEIFNELSQAVEKEFALAQNSLAENVAEQAKKISLKMHIHTCLMWGTFALILVLLYGGILLWAGHNLGTGQTQSPVQVLKMPVGVIVGALCVGCGIFEGGRAANSFAGGNVFWRLHLLVSLVFLLPSGWIFSLTFF